MVDDMIEPRPSSDRRGFSLSEVGVTNLGPVPDGMMFIEAVAAVAAQRKYQINPDHLSRRLTLCETLREIHRIADGMSEPDRSDIQMLAAAAFDFGKRMDARMKELKTACSR